MEYLHCVASKLRQRNVHSERGPDEEIVSVSGIPLIVEAFYASCVSHLQ
jgi:hypothetical protein